MQSCWILRINSYIAKNIAMKNPFKFGSVVDDPYFPPVPRDSHNKCRILLKTLEQLSIDNLTLMNSYIEYALKRWPRLSPICNRDRFSYRSVICFILLELNQFNINQSFCS
jgi:hypothetical protein